MSQVETRPELFDRQLGQLDGLPDVERTKPTTIRVVVPIVGDAQTFIVQTIRQRERGDTIFIEAVSAGQTVRLAFPPQVADTIARQREALNGKVRSKAAKAVAADRKARGIEPGFMRARRAKKR